MLQRNQFVNGPRPRAGEPIDFLERMVRRDLRKIRDRDPGELEDLLLELATEFGLKGSLAVASYRRANAARRR